VNAFLAMRLRVFLWLQVQIIVKELRINLGQAPQQLTSAVACMCSTTTVNLFLMLSCSHEYVLKQWHSNALSEEQQARVETVLNCSVAYPTRAMRVTFALAAHRPVSCHHGRSQGVQ
jgi:hypothetical protein